MFSRKTQPLETFSKTFTDEQELCGLIRMGFFLNDEKRLLIDWIGATRLLGQLKRMFFRPLFIRSCSTTFFSCRELQPMLMLASLGLSLFLYEVIVGLTSPRAILVDIECTKPCADRSGKSLSWLLQRVMVDAHDLRLTIVSFLTLRSRVFLALFSAMILSDRRD